MLPDAARDAQDGAQSESGQERVGALAESPSLEEDLKLADRQGQESTSAERPRNWKQTAKAWKLKAKILEGQLESLTHSNRVLHSIADSKVSSIQAACVEQKHHVQRVTASAEALFDAASALLGNRLLREKVQEQEAAFNRLRQELEQTRQAAERKAAQHQAELAVLLREHEGKLDRQEAEHKQQLASLQSALAAEREGHERTRQQLSQERKRASGLMVTLGESCMEMTWKRKLNQVKVENEGLKLEVSKLKRQCTNK